MKVEDRPEIAEPVLDRRAGERDARPRVDLLGGARLFGAGILDRLRFVQHGEVPRRGEQRGHAQQRSVARDDEVDVRDPVAIERLQLGGRSSPRDARRAPSASARSVRSPPPSSRAATPARRAGWCAASPRPSPARSTSINASTCIVLPRPMSSARQAPRPRRREQMQPPHARLLIGAQRRLERVARIESRQRVGIAKAGERRRQPRSGDDARPVGRGRPHDVAGDVRAGEQPHRFGEREAALGGRRLHRSELVEHAVELLAIDFDPASADEVKAVRCGEQSLDLRRGQWLAVERDRPSGNRAAPPCQDRTAACRRPWRSPADAADGSLASRPARAR